MHRSQWCPALWVTFSSTARLRILKESQDKLRRHGKRHAAECNAAQRKGSNLVNTILIRRFSTIQKLDVLCYTCLNHIFIRFQYSSQLLKKKEQRLRLQTHPATKSLFRAFSCVQHIVRRVGYHILQKRYLLHNKVIKVVSTFASISYHWSLSAVIRRTHSNFPMPSPGSKKGAIWQFGGRMLNANIVIIVLGRKYVSLLSSKILGSKLVSKEQFSSLGFCILPPNC